MNIRDAWADVAAILYPLVPADEDDPDHSDDTWRAYAEAVENERREFLENARAAVENDGEYDPVLGALAESRRQIAAAQADMRRLLAYAREFTRPRPYRLGDLADAAGMSISGVRTAYDHGDVNAVARYTGAKPREWRVQDDAHPA